MRMNLGLKGRVVIITGGGSGLGQDACLAFSREGAKVVIADIDPEKGNKTLQDIKSMGGEAVFTKVDVSSEEDMKKMAEMAFDAFRQVDALVNFAGIPYEGNFLNCTYEQWRRQFAVHLDGAFLCAKAVVPHMISQRYGKIVLVGSFGAYVDESAPYCLAKASVMVFTRGLARVLAPYNINVNSISPGFIRTPMLDHGYPTEEDREKLRRQIPIGRIGEKEDVSNLVLFLCSDCSKHITGVNINNDGGQAIRW